MRSHRLRVRCLSVLLRLWRHCSSSSKTLNSPAPLAASLLREAALQSNSLLLPAHRRLQERFDGRRPLCITRLIQFGIRQWSFRAEWTRVWSRHGQGSSSQARLSLYCALRSNCFRGSHRPQKRPGHAESNWGQKQGTCVQSQRIHGDTVPQAPRWSSSFRKATSSCTT